MTFEELLPYFQGGLAFFIVILIIFAVRDRKRRAQTPESATPKTTPSGSPSEVASDPFSRLKAGLSKTRGRFANLLKTLVGKGISGDMIDELEEAMITADMGIQTTDKLIRELRAAFSSGEVADTEHLLDRLKDDLAARLGERAGNLNHAKSGPTVILVCGVNGAGKTTSIAKLARHLKEQGKSVLLGAGDTFRAAAVEQLTLWSERLGVDIVKGQSGADPGAVVFDATAAAVARKVDYLIVDTAGRLHTQSNLMKELEKIKRVIQKNIPEAPHEVLLVLDATTGQNAVVQAREFSNAIEVDGIFLAKLDGTAKGGIVVAIRDALDIPVKFIGLGEQPDDMAPFNAESFVDALFASI